MESARSVINGRNPTIFSPQLNLQFQQPHFFNSHEQIQATTFPMKKEQQSSDFRHIEIPPWLITTNSQPFQLGAINHGPSPRSNFSSSSIFPATTRLDQQYTQSGHKDLNLHHPNPNLRGNEEFNSPILNIKFIDIFELFLFCLIVLVLDMSRTYIRLRFNGRIRCGLSSTHFCNCIAAESSTVWCYN